MGDRRDRVDAQNERETEIEVRKALGGVIQEQYDDEFEDDIDED